MTRNRRTFRTILSMACALLIGVSWQGIAPTPLDAATATIVSLSGARIQRSNVALADFDGDGDQELVVGGPDGMLYVVAQDSAWRVVFSRQVANDLNAAGAPTTCGNLTQSDIVSAPAIGDLDGDGHLEIVVTTGGDPGQHYREEGGRNGGVLVYRYNSKWSFSVVEGWPQPKLDIVGKGPGASDPDGCWDGIWGSPALGDVDGDGDLEVAVEGFDRRLHLWHHDGTYVTGWPISPPTIHRGGWSSPAMADIDKDGLPELIFGTDDFEDDPMPYYLYVFNGDGTVAPGFPVEGTQNFQSSPAVGDIDGDGWLDIVVGTGVAETSGGNKVYAWDHNGNLLNNWPRPTDGVMPASPALGDLDGDGVLDVVIGCGSDANTSCKKLYAWHGDGSVVTGFPITPWSNSWDSVQNALPYGTVLADYDSDGEVEILFVHEGSFGIATVGPDGIKENDSSLKTQYVLSSAPVVADVDNDGTLEVVIGGAATQSASSNGAIYIWDVAGGADADLPWPMFHQNVARTGTFPVPPELSFPDEITAMHQYGSGDEVSTPVLLQNVGDGSFDWSLTHTITRLVALPASGTVTDTTSIQFTIDTTGILTGWHTLGDVQVSATSGGEPIEGSPGMATVYLYVGDVFKVALPLVTRSY